MLFDFAARKWTEFSRGTFNNPVWSKDGRYLYYQSYDEGSPIRRVQISSGHIDEIVDFKDLPPGATVSYWGLAADDSPIVSFHSLTADVYSVPWPQH